MLGRSRRELALQRNAGAGHQVSRSDRSSPVVHVGENRPSGRTDALHPRGHQVPREGAVRKADRLPDRVRPNRLARGGRRASAQARDRRAGDPVGETGPDAHDLRRLPVPHRDPRPRRGAVRGWVRGRNQRRAILRGQRDGWRDFDLSGRWSVCMCRTAVCRLPATRTREGTNGSDAIPKREEPDPERPRPFHCPTWNRRPPRRRQSAPVSANACPHAVAARSVRRYSYVSRSPSDLAGAAR